MDLSSINWGNILISFVMFALALSVHECAHAWVANRLGDPTAKELGRITLNPIAHIDLFGTIILPLLLVLTGIPAFGWAKPVPIRTEYFRKPMRDMMLTALAGPISNFLLMTVFFIASVGIKHAVMASIATASDSQLAYFKAFWVFALAGMMVNAILAVFNLIPLPPLDGSNVLYFFLNARQRNMMDSIRPISFLIIAALCYLGLFGVIISRVEAFLYQWVLRL